MIDARARVRARAHGIAPDRFEFQMLYGVRRDLQATLVSAGYRVRIYIPFGREWFPYFMRRLGERPANVMFVNSRHPPGPWVVRLPSLGESASSRRLPELSRLFPPGTGRAPRLLSAAHIAQLLTCSALSRITADLGMPLDIN